MTAPADLFLTLGRNLDTLEVVSDPAERGTQIAPVSKSLANGEETYLGLGRWRATDGDAGPKTIELADPAGGKGPIGFDNQFIGWLLLREKTAEAFVITDSDAATQTLTLATFPGSLVADPDDGEFFQFRQSPPGTTLAAYSYRLSVASVIPVPPGVPIYDAEVTALAGDVITVRDGWVSGGVQPVASDGQHVGRLVRLSERIATDQITDFSYGPGGYGSGRAIFSFADVSDYQVGDWFRRRRFTSYPYGDINQYQTGFPGGMTIIAVDTGANTVEVESRDGGTSVHRFIFDAAGLSSDEVIVYRPVAALREITASDGTAHTLTLDDASGFSLGGGNGAVEILIASSTSGGRVPYFLEHPVYVAPTFPGIGVKFRTINRRNLLGVSNLASNAIVGRWSDLAKLPDGYRFASPFSFASTTDAPTPGGFFNFARETNPLYTRAGPQSLFFSATGGALIFPPIAWTPQFQGQSFSAILALFLTKFANPGSVIAFRFGICLADGSVIPWYDPNRSVQLQPAGPSAPGRPVDFYTRYPTNVWDSLVLRAFDITAPTTANGVTRPSAADIADLSNAQGIVPMLTFEGGGSERIEGYIGGIGVIEARWEPDDVREHYDANRLHQITNVVLKRFAKPQERYPVGFVDLGRMGDAEETIPEVGMTVLVNHPESGVVNEIEEIGEVRTNHNVEGETEIVLGSETRRFEDFLNSGASPTGGVTGGTIGNAPPPGTAPGGVTPPPTGGSGPTIVLNQTIDGSDVVTTFAFVSPGVVKVKFAASTTGFPDLATTQAATPTTTSPFVYLGIDGSGTPLDPGDTLYVTALAYDNNGVESALAQASIGNPAPAAVLVAHYDLALGVTTVSGDVSAIADQSTEGNDVAQASAGSRPTFLASAVNGLPAMRFNGGHTLTLAGASGISLGDFTFAMVYRPRGVAVGEMFSFGNSTNGYALGGANAVDAGIGGREEHSGGSWFDTVYCYDPLQSGDFDIIVAVNSGGTLTFRRNGRVLTPTSSTIDPGVISPIDIAIGRRIGGLNPAFGDVAEIRLYNGALSGGSLTGLESALATKFDIDLSVSGRLPSAISNLELHLESDSGLFSDAAGTTPQSTNGGSVRRWVSLVAGGNDASKSSGNVPTLDTTTTLNSLQTLRFTGASGESLDLPNIFSGDAAGELFVVMKNVADPPASDPITGLMYVGSDTQNTHYPYTDSNIYDAFGTTSRKTVGNLTLALTNWHIYNPISVSGGWVENVNSLVQFVTNTNTVGWATSPTLGKSFGAFHYDGRMAAVLYFGRKLTTAERDDVIAYLRAKYAL